MNLCKQDDTTEADSRSYKYRCDYQYADSRSYKYRAAVTAVLDKDWFVKSVGQL